MIPMTTKSNQTMDHKTALIPPELETRSPTLSTSLLEHITGLKLRRLQMVCWCKGTQIPVVMEPSCLPESILRLWRRLSNLLRPNLIRHRASSPGEMYQVPPCFSAASKPQDPLTEHHLHQELPVAPTYRMEATTPNRASLQIHYALQRLPPANRQGRKVR